MIYALYAVLGLSVLGLLALLLLGRSRHRITTGRFGRMARIGRLSARLWTSWLGSKVRRLFAGKAHRAAYDEARRQRDAEAVTQTMGQMKGAFMKLGQMMSFISESMPDEYRAAMSSLQASAPPMDFTLLRDVVERELGKPLERAFADFDETPLAAASIGQVHRAVLPSGEQVVVKIQYPGVADAIRADMQNVSVLYRMMAMFYPALDPKPVVDELRDRLVEELDYEREARNQQAFYDLYHEHPFVRVPRVMPSHSTKLLLTSEYVDGRRFDEVVADDKTARDRYAEIIYRFVFGSIVQFGVFNGDPHPGNYLFDRDGKVVFLDFGCVKYFSEPTLKVWMALVRSHFGNDPQEFRARAMELGFLSEKRDIAPELLYEYFGYFYEPFRHDREFEFSREYNARSLGMVFKPDGEFAGLTRKLNMPPDFVFVNRIQWGVYSILGTLGATGNWHRIHRELIYGEPASTELGEVDVHYRRRWAQERSLAGAELVLRPEGIRKREVLAGIGEDVVASAAPSARAT